MAQLYIIEHSALVGIEAGRVQVKYTDGLTHSIPLESLDGITIIGKAQVTTSCIGYCLRHGISVQYFSASGSYFGKLSSTQHVNTKRQRAQIKLTENSKFSLELAKIILQTKVHNQIVVIRRYGRRSVKNIDGQIIQMKALEAKISSALTLQEASGYEGSAARVYFNALNTLLNNSDFCFSGRSRQPPKDAFNSMLSFGYSILMNDVYGAIESRGLNPYFGFIHQDREKHPTLASDLMEEWRAPIIDTVVMSLVRGKEIEIENFYKSEETGGILLDKEGLKIFLKKIEKQFSVSMKYLSYVDYPVSFRRAINMQAMQLCKAIENENPSLYKPLIIR